MTVDTTITPDLTRARLVFVTRPYLNRDITVTAWSEVTRPARGQVFEVLGRRLPVAVTEVRGSRRFDVTVVVPDQAAADDLELALSFGEVAFFQVPPGHPLPGPLYAAVGDVATAKRSQTGRRRYVTLPLVEVAAPDPALAGSSITWQGVIGAFPTWADVLAAHDTWLSLLSSVSSPEDEVVG